MVMVILSNTSDAVKVTKTESPTLAQEESELFDAMDWVGNTGNTVSATTNGSSVLFDMTPPDDFTLGDVVSKNGIEVAGYWNASNQTLDIVIPIPNDETLPNGGIQLQTSFGGGYSNLADTVSIEESDLGTDKLISVSEADFESVSDYIENGNTTFRGGMLFLDIGMRVMTPSHYACLSPMMKP